MCVFEYLKMKHRVCMLFKISTKICNYSKTIINANMLPLIAYYKHEFLITVGMVIH